MDLFPSLLPLLNVQASTLLGAYLALTRVPINCLWSLPRLYYSWQSTISFEPQFFSNWVTTHTHTHTHTSTHTHTHIHTHAHTHTHIHTRAQVRAHTHTHTHARIHTRARIHTHARAHTHTHKTFCKMQKISYFIDNNLTATFSYGSGNILEHDSTKSCNA
jgi:hypothetical protein